MTDALIPFTAFPFRTKRCVNESLVGYVYRFLSHNGHRATVGGYYAAVCRIYAGKILLPEGTFEKLALALGEEDYFETSFWHERNFFLEEKFYGSSMTFPTLRARSVWFCSSCMKECPIHREYWTFPTANSCPVHNQWLISVCRVCNRNLYWGSLKAGWRCSEGHKIYEIEPQEASMRMTRRDQLFSLHTQFRAASVPEYFRKYCDQVAFHEVYVAYLLSIGWANDIERNKLKALGWGVERRLSR